MPQPHFGMRPGDRQEHETAVRASHALPGREHHPITGRPSSGTAAKAGARPSGKSGEGTSAASRAGDRSEIAPSCAEECLGRAGAYTAGFVSGRLAGCVLPGIQFPD